MTRPPADPAAQAASRHTPVMVEACLDLLAPAIESSGSGGVMIDCTLGMGGHTEAALERFSSLTVIGIDRDPQAIEMAGARLARFGERFRAVHATYDAVGEVAAQASPYGDGTVDAVLADLGVSSLQLDDVERGFSYSRPAPLDMRMDQSGATSTRTAADLLASADAGELTRILRTWGEERFASRIAQAIVRRREAGNPVSDTADLAELVRSSIPAAARRSGGHPAKRTFQALRVAVNGELDVLERMVPRALNSLRVGGRMVVESYQSLEDRIVKRAFTQGARPSVPADMPVIPQEADAYLRLLTHGARQADDAEREANPRSAPVRLRAVERIRPAASAAAPEPGEPPPGSRRARPARTPRTRHTPPHHGRTQR